MTQKRGKKKELIKINKRRITEIIDINGIEIEENDVIRVCSIPENRIKNR